MDYLLIVTFEVEKVIRELGVMSFEPFKEEWEELMLNTKSFVKKHVHALNESLVNFFKRQPKP
jgi:hypothetical protein